MEKYGTLRVQLYCTASDSICTSSGSYWAVKAIARLQTAYAQAVEATEQWRLLHGFRQHIHRQWKLLSSEGCCDMACPRSCPYEPQVYLATHFWNFSRLIYYSFLPMSLLPETFKIDHCCFFSSSTFKIKFWFRCHLEIYLNTLLCYLIRVHSC